jgi:flagellum-specific ATP synthase
MGRAVFETLSNAIAAIPAVRAAGRVAQVAAGTLVVEGLSGRAALGDRVDLPARAGVAGPAGGEVIGIGRDSVVILPDQGTEGAAIGDLAIHAGPTTLAPDDGWIGRIVDPLGRPLDGRPLLPGPVARPLRAAPPPAAARRALGARLDTGLCAFDTLLPLVRGQRIGLFAGSGVGKSSLLGTLARGVAADVVVLALIGERGREVRHFVDAVLGPAGMARSVVVSATADESPLSRRRAALAAMTVAEHFRDAGAHVLFLADSVTRFAEAHREVALASGEAGTMRGFPPSIVQAIGALAERAGPGAGAQGDITAVFSVLVAGSDMDEPVADIVRGILDGHVVLDRRIAERGRFPAVDLLRSVSRSLPGAASADENRLIAEARRLAGAWDRAEAMIQAGLYAAGSDPATDAAIRCRDALEAFLAGVEPGGADASFARLAAALTASGG